MSAEADDGPAQGDQTVLTPHVTFPSRAARVVFLAGYLDDETSRRIAEVDAGHQLPRFSYLMLRNRKGQSGVAQSPQEQRLQGTLG